MITRGKCRAVDYQICVQDRTGKAGTRIGNGAEGGTRTPTSYLTRPSNVRVYQFRHFGSSGKNVNRSAVPTSRDCGSPASVPVSYAAISSTVAATPASAPSKSAGLLEPL